MIWKITSADGKHWVQWNGDGWKADRATTPDLDAVAGKPVPQGAMSYLYIPREDPDQLGVYFHALQLLGADSTISGNRPQLPAMPDDDDGEHVVY